MTRETKWTERLNETKFQMDGLTSVFSSTYHNKIDLITR